MVQVGRGVGGHAYRSTLVGDDRAVAAGATIVRGLRYEEYGSRGFSAADPEGNLWSFGTYAGD